MENVSPIITAKNLNLWYGDFKALKDISLDMGCLLYTSDAADE